MKLQFDANQDYQLKAVKSTVDIFKGQPAGMSGFRTEMSLPEDGYLYSSYFVVGNRFELAGETILKNVQTLQKANDIEVSKELDGLHFSFEMETGTGKTYVYLRTIHELYKTYGFKKFIIVVPSLAIKEGVLKNLEITKEHFDTIYENPEMDFYVYDPKKRGLSRNFATTNSLQILVMNIDQFARAGNIIYQDSDWGIPIQFIQSVKPIVIVDEPQNMETENRKHAIENLNPLCTLRYSATHKFHYNLIYSLDPVRAYDLGLVKKIEVDGIETEDTANEAYVELKSVTSRKNTVSAKIRIDVSDKEGVKKKDISVRAGSDLFDLSNNRDIYKTGFIINEIDVQGQSITFSNGLVVYAGQRLGGLTDEIIKFQIERTVTNHLDKEKRLKGTGLKVLSLFFIDRVANYREYGNGKAKKGKYAQWFEDIFNRLSSSSKYQGVIPYRATKIHNGYFSQDRKGILKDTGGDSQADDDTYALIMKDKEKLLSVDEPLRFIFSHSALREGWDNPNVFQICTLNETQSEIKKRQEIGRGLRLPVNQDGLRVFDPNINILTVTANESYEDFAKALQTEIEDECGVDFSGRIKKKKQRRRAMLKKGYALDENFKALWDKIKQRTKYQVNYSTEKLIKKAGKAISEKTVSSPKLLSRKALLDMKKNGLEGHVLTERRHEVEIETTNVPDVLGFIQSKTRITKDTILKSLKISGRIPDIFKNPQQFMDMAANEINHVLTRMMIDGIKYEKIAGQFWEMRRFESKELEGYLEDMVKVKNKNKTLYDYILIESDVEKRFAHELEDNEDVKFYFKLPFWFKIETPMGTYNPDWAIVFENDKRIYFVAETKGTNRFEKLTPDEQDKIKCGRKHFENFEDVEFKAPVSKVSDIMIN